MTLFFVCLSAQAHKAHSHNLGSANLAFDGVKGFFELEIPATAIIDFEHKPKNSIQKMKLQKSIQSLTESLPKILILDETFGCQLSNSQSSVIYSGKNDSHSEFKLTAEIQCLQTPTLPKIKIKALSEFPKLEKIQVQTIIGTQQKSFVLTPSKDTLN